MKFNVLAAAMLSTISATALQADEVINNDLVVQSSLCVGAECGAEEVFGFDTLRLKSDKPVLKFLDTSLSAAFPGTDWSMGIVSDGGDGPARFFISDDDGSSTVLLLEADPEGGVAIGAGAELEPGAISVGAPGAERRIVNVADGVDPGDAATVGQLNTFTAQISSEFAAELSEERAVLDNRIGELEVDLDALSSRLNALTTRLGLE